eukprot:CAMPEP_0203683102 /NCGR_PEP_ID=MMETSP0090-20130426/47344_1 /ASSEMBLY_ACC=CAM_ASM_001088 /TAXON_ID=426623 /ORGANISM="Chaetoceros affinis, Strain CCMP159" /LENGTH=59 /DNA_ID=CAMNT_0050552225 /DNA_START=1377 /DNA_END=1553 /DNA_ORIENTATION=+
MAAPVGFEPFALLFFETVATKAPSSQASTGEPLTDSNVSPRLAVLKIVAGVLTLFPALS